MIHREQKILDSSFHSWQQSLLAQHLCRCASFVDNYLERRVLANLCAWYGFCRRICMQLMRKNKPSFSRWSFASWSRVGSALQSLPRCTQASTEWKTLLDDSLFSDLPNENYVCSYGSHRQDITQKQWKKKNEKICGGGCIRRRCNSFSGFDIWFCFDFCYSFGFLILDVLYVFRDHGWAFSHTWNGVCGRPRAWRSRSRLSSIPIKGDIGGCLVLRCIFSMDRRGVELLCFWFFFFRLLITIEARSMRPHRVPGFWLRWSWLRRFDNACSSNWCGFLWCDWRWVALDESKTEKSLSREMVAEVMFLIVERLFGFLHKSCF